MFGSVWSSVVFILAFFAFFFFLLSWDILPPFCSAIYLSVCDFLV